jgi:CRP-like cAMP-binding protein
MQTTAEERQLLSRSFLFRGTRPDTLNVALQDVQTERRNFPKGTVIFSRNKFDRAFCVLLAGKISVTKETADGRGLHISTLLPGAYFGAAALFNSSGSFATELTAMTACRIILFPESLLLQLMRYDFAVAENYIRYQSERILFLNEKIASLSAGSAEKRLAHYLLENAQMTENGLLCPLSSVSMSSLANSLNIGRASLYRALDALVRSGAVINQNKDILIQDPALLRQI